MWCPINVVYGCCSIYDDKNKKSANVSKFPTGSAALLKNRHGLMCCQMWGWLKM